MLYADNLQHGFFIDSFALPRCAILDSPTIDKISTADRRGDTAKGEYGHLRVRFFWQSSFFSVQSLPLLFIFAIIFCSWEVSPVHAMLLLSVSQLLPAQSQLF
jgi:hypothetical protein